MDKRVDDGLNKTMRIKFEFSGAIKTKLKKKIIKFQFIPEVNSLDDISIDRW